MKPFRVFFKMNPSGKSPASHYRDWVIGSEANEVINTGANDDVIYSGAGFDQIDGGDGIDTLYLTKSKIEYLIDKAGSQYEIQLKDNPKGGINSIINLERLKFSDINLALDVNENAGEAYRIYEAAFNRKPDASGLGYWISQLDKGLPLKSVAEGFLGSAEFQKLYGSSPTNVAFVDNLYKNILDRAGEKAGIDFWVGQLNNGVSRADVLIGFSESAENKAGVIGAIQNGIEYKEWLG